MLRKESFRAEDILVIFSTGFYADRQATAELQDQERWLAHLPLRPADRNLPDILSSEGAKPLQPSRFSHAGC